MITDPKKDYEKGWVPFVHQKIYLDSRPLIPRPETEFWTEKVIREIGNKKVNVLDLFSGSGAIGVSILAECPNTHVTFGEIEEKHLPTIEKNIKENGINLGRAKIIKTDVWSKIDGKFDFVLLNPPYISKERNTVESSVLENEPEEALFAENDGMKYIEKTIAGLPDHLNKGGQVWIEHEPFQTEKIINLLKTIGVDAETQKDQYGNLRYTRGLMA